MSIHLDTGTYPDIGSFKITYPMHDIDNTNIRDGIDLLGGNYRSWSQRGRLTPKSVTVHVFR